MCVHSTCNTTQWRVPYLVWPDDEDYTLKTSFSHTRLRGKIDIFVLGTTLSRPRFGSDLGYSGHIHHPRGQRLRENPVRDYDPERDRGEGWGVKTEK